MKENIFNHPTSNILSPICIHFGFKFIFHFFQIFLVHIEISKLSHGFWPITCLGIHIWCFISIRDQKIINNYNFYYLIIIVIARIVASVKCGVFKMSKMNHLTMFLPFIDFQFPCLCWVCNIWWFFPIFFEKCPLFTSQNIYLCEI